MKSSHLKKIYIVALLHNLLYIYIYIYNPNPTLTHPTKSHKRCVLCINVFIYIYIYIYVRTRFVTNRNSVGFAREKAQTISFIERGFERLGLGHQTTGLFVVFIHVLNRVRPESLSLGGGLRGSGFWPFFPASLLVH